jgi:hypothetical protein
MEAAARLQSVDRLHFVSITSISSLNEGSPLDPVLYNRDFPPRELQFAFGRHMPLVAFG